MSKIYKICRQIEIYQKFGSENCTVLVKIDYMFSVQCNNICNKLNSELTLFYHLDFKLNFNGKFKQILKFQQPFFPNYETSTRADILSPNA